MALSDRHFIGAALAACAIIAVAKLPPEHEPRPRAARQAPELAVQGRARTRLRQAGMTLGLLELRDSALALASRRPAPAQGGPLVFHGRDIPARLRVRLDSVLQREITGLGAPLAAMPVVVLVASDMRSTDSPWTSTRWIESAYFLPAATDGRACISVVRVGKDAIDGRATRRNGRLVLDIALEGITGTMLGPCAYYGAHGMPGPQMAAWLERSRYASIMRAPATDTDSLRSARPIFPQEQTIVDRLLQRAGWSFGREYTSTNIVGCADGRTARCLAALAVSDSASRYAAPILPILTASGGPLDVSGTSRERPPLGSAGRWLMAALHDDAGAEAFGRFWRSELGPEAAHASATGTPLSAATRSWIIETYDIGQGRRWPHPLVAGAQVVLAIGMLAAGLVMRGRRTVAA